MTDRNLSSQAQAVLDATGRKTWYRNDDIAAALRAVADQLLMSEPLGDTDADVGVFAAHHAIHAWLLAIADELEQLDD